MASNFLKTRIRDHQLIADARALDATGKYGLSLPIYRGLIERHPLASDLHFAAAFASQHLRLHDDALRHVKQAIALDPRKSHYHALHGQVLSSFSRVDEGLEAADRSLALNPDDLFGLHVKVELLRIDGRSAEAVEVIESRPRGDTSADPRFMMSYATVLAGVGRNEDAIELLRGVADHPGMPGLARSQAWYQIGTSLDKLRRYDEAFGAFAEGARLREAVHNADAEDERFAMRERLWTKERLASLPRARLESELPVFIVGMPRSGTTLTEQIIASHPEAYGAGERPNIPAVVRDLFRDDEASTIDSLKQGPIDRVARRELREMQKLDRSAERVTDKLPQNFLHLGLIEMLFPSARVIHCRRDPMDNCLSCFVQDFGGQENQGYSYDLGHLGRYYRNYVRFMEHWKRVSGLPILELRYEEMVANQEEMSRRIIEFIGLEWDDACLQFHESDRKVVTLSHDQVRRPMYTSSVKRWKNYERHLGPLRDALGDLAED